jgi:hypothetical protein
MDPNCGEVKAAETRRIPPFFGPVWPKCHSLAKTFSADFWGYTGIGSY